MSCEPAKAALREHTRSMSMENCLYIVVPCYNEEEVLRETTKRLSVKLATMIEAELIAPSSKVLYVNDGSKDGTWELVEEIHRQNPLFSGISLAHNRGHQNALLAGLMTAKEYADVVISMDADLQDDIEIIDEMVRKCREGYDVVYAVRSARKKDSFFKRFSAESFYKLIGLMGVEIVYNHADYRLTSRRVLESLEEYREVNLFLRGLFPAIGYRSATVEYERNERFAGESKYPLKKMLAFAWEGITSFTIRPLQFISALGITVSAVSLIVLIALLFNKIFGYTVTGWASVICSIWLVGGLQLFCLGIIGEYIGKIYYETKRRPRFIIDRNLLEE